MRFRVTQHTRDKVLLVSLISYLRCGHYYKAKGNNYRQYKISKFSGIAHKIISFFKEYHMLGVKAQDYEYWYKVANIVYTGNHLTSTGLAEVLQIKGRMNKERRTEDA